MKPILLTLNQLAEGFSTSHDTAMRRLREAGIEPAGKRGGFPVYRLQDAAPHLAAYCLPADAVEVDRLPPLAQKTFWQAMNERVRFETSAGRLIPVDDVRDAFAAQTRIMALALDVLPDQLERDCALRGTQVAKVEDSLDRARQDLYAALQTWAEGTA